MKRNFHLMVPLLLVIMALGCQPENKVFIPSAPARDTTKYTNPLLSSGADPWVIYRNGFYYYTHTTGGNLTLWKTPAMSELSLQPSKVVWTAPTSGANSRDVWAPELHFLDGKWYLYYTAGPGDISQQRMWVLENAAADPTTGIWTDRGQVITPNGNHWAIDATVLQHPNGKNYLVWSGHDGVNNTQRIYLSEMTNPWTLTGTKVEISSPTQSWETDGDPDVNEGPEVLIHNNKIFIVYSGSGCWTDNYALGLLSADASADPLVPGSWTKLPTPVFTRNDANSAFGPGHNGFFKSKDGQEDWIIYHANPRAGQGCSPSRTPRMQKLSWNPDGTPNFGTPAPINVPLEEPSGE